MDFAKTISSSFAVHMGIVAVLFLTGGGNETRNKRPFTVSLFEEFRIEKSEQPHVIGVQNKTDKPGASRKMSAAPAPNPVKKTQETHEATPAVPEPMGTTFIVNAKPGVMNTGLRGNSEAPKVGSPVSTGGQSTHGKGSADNGGNNVPGGRGEKSGDGELSYKQRIRDSLQTNLIYPYLARKKRIEGMVFIEFGIDRNGRPQNIRVVKSSGQEILDSAAKETVLRASPFPAADYAVKVPITFMLKDK